MLKKTLRKANLMRGVSPERYTVRRLDAYRSLAQFKKKREVSIVL